VALPSVSLLWMPAGSKRCTSGCPPAAWESLIPRFRAALRSSEIPTSPGCTSRNLEPLAAVDLLHVAAREVSGPVDSVLRVAALVEAVGLTWYPVYKPSLQTLMHHLGAAPEDAPEIAQCLRRLVDARLCTAPTAPKVAAALSDTARIDEATGGALELLDSFCPVPEDASRQRLLAAMPTILRGLSSGCDSTCAVTKGLARLCVEGVLFPGPALDNLQCRLARLDQAAQCVALRLLRATTQQVLPAAPYKGAVPRRRGGASSSEEGEALQPCTEKEIEDALTLAEGLSTENANALCELGNAGIMRSDWGVLLATLSTMKGERRMEALRCAEWLHAASPAWLSWAEVFARVEALAEKESGNYRRQTVMSSIAEVLLCREEREMRMGKDEDKTTGVSPRFERWIRWLLQVAHSPKWLDIVSDTYVRLLPLDPGGKSCLISRLASAHSFPCGWCAPHSLGCTCYCEYILETVVPQLMDLCDDPSVELFDAVASYIRWRRGPQLLAAMTWLEEAAAGGAGAAGGPLRKASIVAELLSCHKLFELPAGIKALSDTPLEVAAVASQAVCKVSKQLPAAVALAIFQHLAAGWKSGALQTRAATQELATGLARLLARAPENLRAANVTWLSMLLRSCCVRWRLGGVGASHLTELLVHACRQTLNVRTTCRSPPPLLALLTARAPLASAGGIAGCAGGGDISAGAASAVGDGMGGGLQLLAVAY